MRGFWKNSFEKDTDIDDLFIEKILEFFLPQFTKNTFNAHAA